MKLKGTSRTVLAAAIAVGTWGAAPVRAEIVSLVVGFQSGITAAAGSTGNSFEVDVTNLSSTTVQIDSFAFEVTVSSPNITLTSSTDGTTHPYIFDGDSLFGPTLSTFPQGQNMDGSDVSASSAADYVLGGGATVAIGEVFYSVAPGGAAVYTLSFLPISATSFSDKNGNAFTIGSLNPGTITVTGASTPEPSSLSLTALAMAGLALLGGNRPTALNRGTRAVGGQDR